MCLKLLVKCCWRCFSFDGLFFLWCSFKYFKCVGNINLDLIKENSKIGIIIIGICVNIVFWVFLIKVRGKNVVIVVRILNVIGVVIFCVLWIVVCLLFFVVFRWV